MQHTATAHHFLIDIDGGSPYWIAWAVELDPELQAIFKALRIRPSSVGPIQTTANTRAALGNTPVYRGFLTPAALKKLQATGLRIATC